MSLVDVEFALYDSTLPGDVESFIREAESRIDHFNKVNKATARGFVASDFITVYRALHTISEGDLGPCHSFCEWGSGFGVVTSLASMLEFDACGIEIDRPLYDNCISLAEDFGLPANFVLGSFIPQGGEALAEEVYTADGGDFFWLETNADDAYDLLGLDPDDFDVIFAYPWPGEERVIERLFDRFAAVGALLLTYLQLDQVRVRRKQ